MAGQKLNLLDVVDELSLLFERRVITTEKEFGGRLNERYKELGYKEPKNKKTPNVYRCWKQRFEKTEIRYIDGEPLNDDDLRVINIRRRFDVTFCSGERGSANADGDNVSFGATSRGRGIFGTGRSNRGGLFTSGGNNQDSNSSIFGRGVGSGGGGNFGSGEGGAFGSSRGNYGGDQGSRGGLFSFDDNNEDGSNASGSLRDGGSGASISRGRGGGIFGTTANGDDNQHSRGRVTFGNNDGNQEGSGFGRRQGGYGGGGTFRQQTNSGFRFHIRPELVLTEVSVNDLNAALDEAEETAKKVQEGRALEAISEFYKKDAAKVWDLLLADTMQKSHDTTANEWTDVDRRVVRIAFTWSSYTTGWGKRAFEVPASPSGSAMDRASSIHSNGDSSTGNRDQSESTQASPTQSESASCITVQSDGGNKRKLSGCDAVPPKRMSTDGFRSRSFPMSFLTASLNQVGNHQSSIVPSQRNTGEPHRTTTPASSQDVNQRHSTIQSTPGHTNPPQNDLAAPATSSPQETVQSNKTKQIIQISTSLNYCTRWLQDSKLVSVCSGNVPVIQILLKKAVDVHLCRGIDEANLTHRTTPFRPRGTSVATPPQCSPQVAEVRLSYGFSILDLDDVDDTKQKIVCLDGEQEAVAVISFPADFTIYQSWVDENVHMISIPAGLVSS